jgi:uncharacterized CHY-type Zn-finger protein
MGNIDYLCVGATISVAAIVASSCYEYYKCKRIYDEKPDATFNDIKRKHNVLESLILTCGLAGHKMASYRNHMTLKEERKKEQARLLGNIEIPFTLSYEKNNQCK